MVQIILGMGELCKGEAIDAVISYRSGIRRAFSPPNGNEVKEISVTLTNPAWLVSSYSQHQYQLLNISFKKLFSSTSVG